jgi:ABC-2 type transport system permease protein
MNLANIILVAKREMLEILKMKSFWLTLLILPLSLALAPLLGRSIENSEPTRVTVIDQSRGTSAASLQARLEFDEAQYLLRELSQHVQRFDLQKADPNALWAGGSRWYTRADTAAFKAAGGIEAALKKIEAVAPSGTPKFKVPIHDYEFIAPPSSLLAAQGLAFDTTARALFADDPDDKNPEIIALIPKDYPADLTIKVYSANSVPGRFVTKLQDVLTVDLRTDLLAQSGVTGERAELVQNIAPKIAIDTPAPGGGAREALFVRSIVPIALSYILLMSLMLSGSWMLQGSVEERSNKLIESLLACISPEELMYGKLVGSLSVGLMMLSVWAGCAGIAAFATKGAIADMIRPALEPLSSPGIIVAIIYFFVAGYIGICAIFVAIGALVESMSEAQGYLMPVLLLIMLPIMFLLQAALSGSNGIIVQILTWVPLWTPFTVLSRLGLGMEIWELVGSGIVLALAIGVELVLVARLFRNSLLATGQKPTLAKIWSRLKRSPQGSV